jgi:hypothetical protein
MHELDDPPHEGCVSAMLTESGLSIALRVCDFKASARRKAGCKPTSTPLPGVSVVTIELITSDFDAGALGCLKYSLQYAIHQNEWIQ